MANTNAKHDDNYVPSALFAQVANPSFVTPGQIDQTTGRILVDANISGSTIAAHFQTDTFSSTNNQTTFTPTQTLIQDNGFYVNGSRQMPAEDYSIVGGSYVLNSGIPSGCDIIITYIY